LPLTFPVENVSVTGEWVARTLGPGASLVIETNVPEAQSPLTGWAELTRQPSPLTVVFNVSGMAAFRGVIGTLEEEATAAFQTGNPSSWVLPFDQTRRRAAGVAVVNLADRAGDVGIVMRNDAGVNIGEGKISLPSRGHRGIILSSEFPQTSGRRGTIEFQRPSGGQIGVFAVQSGPSPSLAFIPPIAR
jgi:hypothetical protein